MEPPAKRMRIMQSIGVDEVDESNPDYIEGKKQNSEWLKNKFGSIFAKYEAMSDMMSDEWDMREGKVVVDRGHARRWDMEYRKRLGRRTVHDESQLVDDLFVNDPDMEGVDDESDCDVRDELAPSQSPEPVARRPVASTAVVANNTQEPPFPARAQVDVPVPETPINTLQSTIAASANPAADLVQLVRFPQTPAGQQARKAFEVQTAQAVQQAVASILSSLLPNTPSLQPHQLSLPHPAATPDLNPVHIAPATVPDLRSMLPPAPIALEPTAIQSSPITTAHSVRRKRRSLATGVLVRSRRPASAEEDVPLILEPSQEVVVSETEALEPSTTNELATSADAEILKSATGTRVRRGQRKYVFTTDDDKYIIESKIIRKKGWREIMNSRAEWKIWPVQTFHTRWSLILKKKAAEMGFSPTEIEASQKRTAPVAKQQLSPKQAEQSLSSPLAARHLPTPSSLEKDEAEPLVEPSALDNIGHTIASGGHFDDDERDLLSIYGDTDSQHPQTQPPDNPEESLTDASQEIPETPLNLTQEDSIQQILQGTFTRDNTADLPAPSVETSRIQTPLPEPATDPAAASTRAPSTSTPPTIPSKHTTKRQPPFPPPHTCPLCHQTFPTLSTLTTHTAQPHPREILYRPSSPPPATQFDPLAAHAPVTPLIKIKREPRSSPSHLDAFASSPHIPAAPSALSTPMYTQRSARTGVGMGMGVRPGMGSGSVERRGVVLGTPVTATAQGAAQGSANKPSSAKMSRAEYRAVRASWARGKGTPGGKKRRRRSSMVGGEGGRKKVWRGEGGGGFVGIGRGGEESGDELGA